jgi:hypothetical protein
MPNELIHYEEFNRRYCHLIYAVVGTEKSKPLV